MVKVKLLKREALRVTLPGRAEAIGVTLGPITVVRPPDVEYYEGDYEVTPLNTEQVLPTAEKCMSSDVHIKATPFHEVENVHGGTTIIIGG